MLNFKSYHDTLHKSDDISHWKAQPNTQFGTNPGGIHTSPTGEKHYVKFYRNPDQAKAEVASAKIYEHLGVKTLEPKLVNYKGHVGVASKWRDDLKDVHPSEFDSPSNHMKTQLAKHYVAGILTKNWDSIGTEYDNVKKTPSGDLLCVDHGGALHFRAQGAPKAYSRDIGERETFHDPVLNPQSTRAFKSLGDHHVTDAFHSMSHAHAHIEGIFAASGLPNHKEFADTFKVRHALLKDNIS